MTENTHQHPEWKRLKMAMQDLLGKKTEFSYAELSSLAGVDVQSERGRQQFYRFRKAMLKERDIWFECVLGRGYRIIPASEHAIASQARVQRGRRQIRRGYEIALHTKLEELSEQQRSNHLLLTSAISGLLQAVSKTSRVVDKLAGSVEVQKLPPAPDILEQLKAQLASKHH